MLKNVDMKKIMPVVALLFAAMLWGLQGVTTRDLSLNLDPVEMFGLRSIITLIVLGVIMLIFNRHLFTFDRKLIPFFILFGVTKLFSDTLCFDAQIKLNLSLASVLFATEPYFVAIISYFLFKERLTKIQVISIFAAFFGCMVICGIFEGFYNVNPIGVLEGLGSGLVFAIYTVSMKHGANVDLHPATALFYTFLISFIITLFFVDYERLFDFTFENTVNLRDALLFGILFTVIPYYLQLIGLKSLSATVASVTMLFSTVVSAIAGFFYYKEPVTITDVIGMLIIFIALMMINSQDVKYKNMEE